MYVRQAGNGEWYICRSRRLKGIGRRANKDFRNWFLIKSSGNSKARLDIKVITFPKEFFGKKIRLKIEVIK